MEQALNQTISDKSLTKDEDPIIPDTEKLAQLEADYERIRAYLDNMCDKGQLTEFEKRTIIDMSKKVLGGIAARHPKVREGVNRVMGGNVLDYEAKDILRQGISQGISQGIEQGSLLKLIEQICRKLTRGKSTETIAEELEEKPETIRNICAVAAKYAPEYDVAAILKECRSAAMPLHENVYPR